MSDLQIGSAGSASTLEAALRYHERNLAPIPVKHQGKAPLIREFNARRLTRRQLEARFSKGDRNVGIALGRLSNGIVDVDLDCPEALQLAPHLLPSTGFIFGRKSCRRSHWIYRCEARVASARYVFEQEMLVELRGEGLQTVFPPSVHESGETVEFDQDGSPTLVDATDLHVAVMQLAIACALVKCWPRKPGNRHQLAMHLSGALAACPTFPDVPDFVEIVASAAGDEEAAGRRRTAEASVEKRNAGEPVTGWQRLTKIEPRLAAVRGWTSTPNANVPLPRERENPKHSERAAIRKPPRIDRGACDLVQLLRDGGLLAADETRSFIIAAALELKAMRKAGEFKSNWTPLWPFLRRLKSHPALTNLEVVEMCNLVEAASPGEDVWTAYLEVEREEGRAELAGTWHLPKLAPGRNPVELALERARHSPLELPRAPLSEGYRFFVSFAAYLQVANGPGELIWWGSDAIARHFNVTGRALRYWEDLACREGYLECRHRGRFVTPERIAAGEERGAANKYVFRALEKFPDLWTEALGAIEDEIPF